MIIFYSIININNSTLRKVFKKVCNKIYNAFDNLLIASRGYEDILINEGISNKKLHYLPQWAEDFYSNSKFLQNFLLYSQASLID